MPTTRETILSALHALLQTQAAPVLRGEVLPERVPAAGLLILRDGEPGEPAVTLSPLRYHYQHRAEIEAVVQAGTGRDAAFDALAGRRRHRARSRPHARGLVRLGRGRGATPGRPGGRGCGDASRLPSSRSCCTTRAPIRSDDPVSSALPSGRGRAVVAHWRSGERKNGSGSGTARSRGHDTYLLAPPHGAWAQAPADACALLSRDEFQALTGKTEYGDPTGMPWSGGTVCGFGNGQIILLPQADSTAVMDRFLATAEKDLVSPRTPVDGLGDGAFSVLFDPDDPYQDHGAFVVFGAGPPTVAATVYAEEGEPAEAALAPAMAVAEAIAAKLQ